jgi:2-keto-4-pentenoate hydratase/2-oxohepta-3-ene-1,7-dioic acid hydratase in catechol pathway
MKLLRYGPAGHEQPAVLDHHGNIRSLTAHLSDIGPEQLSPAGLQKLAAIDPASLPKVPGHPRLGVPCGGTRKFIGIGLNYAEHAAEANLSVPTEPVVFMKAISSLQGAYDEVMIPRDSEKTDWEVELGVFIGRTARYVEERSALEYVAGYTIVNDISERAFQMERGGTWDKGKSCDTFGPVGPWLVTRDEVSDVHSLGLWLDLNGERMQTGNTRTMIFSVAAIVSYVSHFMTLEPGDLITTGSPPGSGLGHKPQPFFLRPGDVMQLGVEKLGEQRQRVIGWRRG